MTNSLLIWYMVKYLRISSYIRNPFLIYDVPTAPFSISLYFIFFFISVPGFSSMNYFSMVKACLLSFMVGAPLLCIQKPNSWTYIISDLRFPNIMFTEESSCPNYVPEFGLSARVYRPGVSLASIERRPLHPISWSASPSPSGNHALAIGRMQRCLPHNSRGENINHSHIRSARIQHIPKERKYFISSCHTWLHGYNREHIFG
jgi:hypothetical protein